MNKIIISGIVQGVGFRPFIFRLAKRFNLRGHIKNLGDSGVEIVVDGDDKVREFVESIRKEKPVNAEIDEIKISGFYGSAPSSFLIVESGDFGGNGIIPVDSAVCGDCLGEIFDSKNKRRFHYPFTSCVNCGSRFSTTGKIPYDRKNTSFSGFEMCDSCRNEYEDAEDRRFHYQGNTCVKCGPEYALYDKSGSPVFGYVSDLIGTVAEKLGSGALIAVKGVTGTHIACRAAEDSGAVLRLRSAFKRRNKPFAVMAKNIDEIKKFALVSSYEEKVLLSSAKPIVLLKKSRGYFLSGEVSPGLDNIGVMLPYTGIHHLIFDLLDFPLVMTSANFSGEPMLIDNNEIIEKLSGIADFYLLHNLKIENRCDDSVVKFADNTPLLIRRSRGFAPAYIKLPFNSKTTLCLGTEMNNTICLIKENKAYISQYVGNTSKYETLKYMDSAVKNMLELTSTDISEVNEMACDLNPAFDIKAYAGNLADKYKIKLNLIPHHYAHVSSLIGEHNVSEVTAIAVDGTGYGLDGNSWGGEIITAKDGKFERTAHLKEQKMPGGDLATAYPLRMLAGILFDSKYKENLHEFLSEYKNQFKYKEKEIEIIIKQLESNLNVTKTTSCGRILDAASALLGICFERTYEGEPAMKLESASEQQEFIKFIFPVEVNDGVLNTTKIIEKAVELKTAGESIGKIGASVEYALAIGLSDMAVDAAKKNKINTVGLTGGVAYNELIHKTIKKEVEKQGLKFITNLKVPCGDGGISFGQGVFSAYSRNRVS